MTPRPEDVGVLAEEAYEGMAPVAKGDEQRNWPLLRFLIAYYMPMQRIHDIVADTPEGPGWTILWHPDRCPERYLPWLAMYAGVRLRKGMSADEIRARIKERDGQRRCTPTAIIKAAQVSLTGNKLVLLRERHRHTTPTVDAPGYIDVVTYTNETPDPEATYMAMLEQKDVGLILVHRIIDGQFWQDVVDDWDTWQDVVDGYDTWQDVIFDIPT